LFVAYTGAIGVSILDRPPGWTGFTDFPLLARKTPAIFLLCVPFLTGPFLKWDFPAKAQVHGTTSAEEFVCLVSFRFNFLKQGLG
jgi:hypothetical protein